MTLGVVISLIVLALEVGFMFGWLLSDYRHAGRELKRIRARFEEDKQRYS